MAAETDAPPRQRSAPKRENVFTRKIGPLPMWAWLAIVGVIIVAWAWYENRNSSSSSSTTANASQVPQFVNQTYTTVQPPSAPSTTTTTGPIPDQNGGTATTTGNPNHITPAEGAQVATALPGTAAAGAVNLAATGIGNQYNTAASKERAQKRKNARIAARKKKS